MGYILKEGCTWRVLYGGSWADSNRHGGHVPPTQFYNWLDTGDTVNSRTANTKLTKLYWPSQKRSPKRLLVLLEQKSGGTRPKRPTPTFTPDRWPHFQIRSGATVWRETNDSMTRMLFIRQRFRFLKCNAHADCEQTYPSRLLGCWTWRRRRTAPLRGPPPTTGSLPSWCEYTYHHCTYPFHRCRRWRNWRDTNLRGRCKCWLGMQDDWERRSHRGELSPTLRITVTLRRVTELMTSKKGSETAREAGSPHVCHISWRNFSFTMHSGSQQPAVSHVTYLEVQQAKVFHVTYVENYRATISSHRPNATSPKSDESHNVSDVKKRTSVSMHPVADDSCAPFQPNDSATPTLWTGVRPLGAY